VLTTIHLNIWLESILPVYQQRDWGPGMVKCVGPTRCLMRPCSLTRILVESSSTFFIFFDDDAYTFTSTRRRLVFSTTTQRIRLRRRVDVFSTTSDITVRRGSIISAHAVLRQLHWLPVYQRIKFKLVVLVYKSLNGLAPQYLVEDCELVAAADRRQLRSSDIATFLVSRTYTRLGDRAFPVAGPRLWNSLPSNLRQSDLTLHQFLRALKTYLFG